MSISEQEYKKMEKDQKKYEKELDILGNRIQPYWDSKTRKIKENAPESIKKDYERFLELFDKVMTKY
ncbi:MAG: hypothetical protein IJI57_04380 [Flexilinea sp.]|nr:hypothetical protein [Flexilinea sp.]